MDDIDGAIIRELLGDGRISMAELGTKIGIAPSTAFKRIEKLKHSGVIERFTISVNPSCYESTFIVFLTLRVHAEAKDDVEEYLAGLVKVLELYEVLEPGDFVAKVRVKSITDLKRDVLIPLANLPGVKEIQTTLSVRKIKEER
jgi:Lrp/AsnC family transcriptional regulator, leucine-responsive regulatory protein